MCHNFEASCLYCFLLRVPFRFVRAQVRVGVRVRVRVRVRVGERVRVRIAIRRVSFSDSLKLVSL